MFSDYKSLEEAFDYYNTHLFEDKLEKCVITLARKKGSRGFYRKESFKHRAEEQKADEIALNPDCFGRPDVEVLSTLVHEMVHKAQYQYGKPGRTTYHNKEWGAWMEQIGLMPSSTGEEGGKRTGQKMTHYIITGGRFEMITNRLMDLGFKINWGSAGVELGALGKVKTARKKTKFKYTCPECNQNAWAKPNALLACGRCKCDLVCEEDPDA